jgi:diguanylate cyclase (GGDEF)-like protein
MFALLAGIIGIAISGSYFGERINGYVHIRWFKYILMFIMALCMVLKFKKVDEKYFSIATSVMMQIFLGTVLYVSWLNDFNLKIAFAYIIVLIVVIPFQLTKSMMIATPLIWIPSAAWTYYNVARPLVEPVFFLFFLILPSLLILVISLEKLNDSMKMEKLALYDPLTDIPNREYARQLIETKIEEGQMFGFLFIDLDNFKQINDSHGHHEGDRVLKSVANCFKRDIREKDTVARMCGDEFIILLMDCEYRQDVENVFERIDSEFDVKIGNKDVTYSVGAVMYPGDASDYEEVLKKADIAMYKSKAKGKNQICFYDDKCDLYLYVRDRDA